MRIARYKFRDASGSESVTSVRLSDFAVDAAILGLASLLDQASDASLIGVDVLQRVVVRDQPGVLMPGKVRIAIRYPEAFPLDAYHALIPAGDETRVQPVIEYLTGPWEWATRYGASLEGSQQAYAVQAYPNWRNYDPPYPVDAPKWILVLDDRLWRDLLTISMQLNSETMRDALLASALPQALARYQLVELLRGIPLDEVLERMDQMIQLLQQIRDRQGNQEALLDDVEPALAAILEALVG